MTRRYRVASQSRRPWTVEMDAEFVRATAAGGGMTGQLGRAALGGSAEALAPLHDALLEEGIARMTSLELGKAYLIQTVTHYYTGRLVAVSLSELVLEDAAWIPSTGRFHEALRTGKLEEVEPFLDPVTLNQGAVVAVTPWRHPLPREAL
jgi:hypothetical protein